MVSDADWVVNPHSNSNCFIVLVLFIYTKREMLQKTLKKT